MGKILKWAEGQNLPVDVMTERIAIMGTTGSGKSYDADKVFELLLALGGQIVVIDTVGIHWSLRVGKDGKSAGFSIPVFGGSHGDFPLDPGAGELIANLIVERNISAVIDVSELLDSDRIRFGTSFGNGLFFAKKKHRSPLLLGLEEAQDWLPQQPQNDEKKILSVYRRICKEGRNFGIGVMMLSQSPQSVDKRSLNLAEVMICHQIIGAHERDAIERWVKGKLPSDHLIDELSSLEVGQACVWSPKLLKIAKIVKVLPRETYDASSTPKFGETQNKAVTLAPVDFDAIRGQLSSLIRDAEANDPEVLRKEIVSLQRQMRQQKQQLPKPEVVRETTVIQVPNAETLEVLRGLRDSFEKAFHNLSQIVLDMTRQLERGDDPVISTKREPSPTSPHTNGSSPSPNLDAPKLRSGEWELLRALVSSYPEGVSKNQLRVQLGFRKDTLITYSGTLKRTSLAVANGKESLAATEAGAALIGNDYQAAPQTPTETLRMWESKIRSGEYRLAEFLISRYPKRFPKKAERPGQEDLSSLGYTGDTLTTYMGTLKRIGLVDEINGEWGAAKHIFEG